MTGEFAIKLNLSCVLNVPIHSYENNFSFIVNGKEFKTSRILSDLLSPNISRIHANDPTSDTFIIQTKHQGDFTKILDLVKFNEIRFTEDELPFISELADLLGIDSIEYGKNNKTTKITIENVFSLIQKHEKFDKIFQTEFSKEIDFISSNFYLIIDKYREEMKKLSMSTLANILNNNKLQLEDEDQLIKFVNEICKENDDTFSNLYEFVKFENASSEVMKEFVYLYNIDNMNSKVWLCICSRLIKDIENNDNNNNNDDDDDKNNNRYIQNSKKVNKNEISFSEKNEFNGIFNYLRNKTSNNIESAINITASSIYSSSYHPKDVTYFDDKNKFFISQNVQNSWICFDFKEYRVIPTAYTIRTTTSSFAGNCHPKSWIIEGSVDNESWETIDNVNNCSYLNGFGCTHTFTINKERSKEFKLIRMKQISSHSSVNFFYINSFELYGKLYQKHEI